MCAQPGNSNTRIVDVFAATDIGPKRKRNEDRSLVRRLDGYGLLAAVADGMGGAAGGDVAAQTSMDVLGAQDFADGPSEAALVAALKEADRTISNLAKLTPTLEGMGTTATVVTVHGTAAYWAHVGDSRLYHLRGGTLRQVSVDHSFLQTFLDDGSMTQEEVEKHPFRHVLDQCVGCAKCIPDAGSLELLQGDILLLSTDGLHKVLSDKAITDCLRSPPSLEAAVTKLIAAALAGGGTDNITVVALRV
jgi:protein phosphatase